MALEKTLKSPLDCLEMKPIYLQEIKSEYSLEGLMPKMKLHYFGHLMRRADSLEKILMLVKTEDGEGSDTERDDWMASLTQWK